MARSRCSWFSIVLNRESEQGEQQRTPENETINYLLLFPHISPIARTRGHRRRLPFPYHRYIRKKKREREEKNNRRESLPPIDRRGGEKIKQEQKNKSKDPPRISERQINKQARQTKCQDHTTVDTVRESLSTPHQSLGGGSGQSSVETKEYQYSNATLFISLTVLLPFSLCMESTSYLFPYLMAFFYLVTTG